jgi:hypothetical protein
VCGGRAYASYEAVKRWLGKSPKPITHIIHGNAPGADTLAGQWARETGVQEVSCPANWEVYGRGAGPRRNKAMLALGPDVVLAFPGGVGTASMVKLARAANVKVIDVKVIEARP